VTREWQAAVRAGDVAALERLHAAGADVDATDQHGQTGLMVAARDAHETVVQWFIARGAGLDHTAKYGLSALMLAVINGHRDIVRMLVDAGADRTLRGSGAPGFAGKTALDLALAREDSEMSGVLQRAETG